MQELPKTVFCVLNDLAESALGCPVLDSSNEFYAAQQGYFSKTVVRNSWRVIFKPAKAVAPISDRTTVHMATSFNETVASI